MIEFDKTYDSHVHFFGVGLEAVDWVIKGNNLNLPDHLSHQNFIHGFGLNSKVSNKELNLLYEKHPDVDFCLSYEDGHSSLISKSLVHKLSYELQNHSQNHYQNHYQNDYQNHYKDHGHFISLFENKRDEFLKLLPKKSYDDLKRMALFSFNYFKNRGVKRVRHMTCNKDQWMVFKDFYSSKNPPSLKIENFFAEFMDQSLEEALEAFEFAKQNPIKGLSAQGIKLFVDGSLSQKTAYMSSFKNSKPRLNPSELYERMFRILVEQENSLALHTIGDLALEMSLEIYQRITQENEFCGTLHLEHAPVFTKKSLKLLKENKLNCTFHFQPSHWIKDSLWYEKEQHLLKPHKIYPFTELKSLGYKFFFGSDAPVEESTVDLTEEGLRKINVSKQRVIKES